MQNTKREQCNIFEIIRRNISLNNRRCISLNHPQYITDQTIKLIIVAYKNCRSENKLRARFRRSNKISSTSDKYATAVTIN